MNERIPWQLCLSAIILFLCSIPSFVFVVMSLNLTKENKNGLVDLIQQWESRPLIDVEIISESEQCQPGWETPIWSPYDRNALQTIGRFPGSLPWCECGPDGFVYTYLKYQYKCDCGPTG